VDLSDPILSRFDVLCVVKDEANVDMDMELATFIVNSHMKCHPKNKPTDNLSNLLLDDVIPRNEIEETIDQNILRKYIVYARNHMHPKLTEFNR